MEKNNATNLSLRVFAGIIMAILLFFFIVMAFFVTNKLHAENHANALDGYLQLTGDQAVAAPVYLNGMWETFDGVVRSPVEVAALTSSDQQVRFPLGSIIQAKKDATYRLRFSLPETPTDTLYLTVPTFDGELTVYLNGVLQEAIPAESEWMPSSTLKVMIPLSNLRMDQQWQELVLSASFSSQNMTLFQRPVLLGSMRDVSSLTTFDGFAEVFAFGILILVIVNGGIFMLFRPGHVIISLITLFDAIILARICFSLNFTLGLAKTIFPDLVVSDAFCRSAELFSLMLGGIIGCLLSRMIYDPQEEVPRWLTWPPMIAYGAFGLFFPFHMDLFERFGSTMLIGVYAYTFVGVFMQFLVCWRSKQNRPYYYFQFLRTLYVGLVVFWDILFWDQYKDFSLLLYAYVIFFILHVVVRLYDNNLSYHHVEVLNQSLEATVAERTKELSRANQILSELSIRDPLTNIFNRIYFERSMEAALAKRSDEARNLHLCIFDLDFFKQVNDTHGHQVGDEVLKETTRIVADTLRDDVLFARIGGEEFILLFDGYSEEEVTALIVAAHEALAQNAARHPQHTTASFGIAAWQPGYTQKDMLKMADKALYEAKNAGRNCISFSCQVSS